MKLGTDCELMRDNYSIRAWGLLAMVAKLLIAAHRVSGWLVNGVGEGVDGIDRGLGMVVVLMRVEVGWSWWGVAC